MRTCEKCGGRMRPFVARRMVGGQRVCEGCAGASRTAGVRRSAGFKNLAALENPAPKNGRHPEEWFHGSPHDFEHFGDPADHQDPEMEEYTDRYKHWNTLVGNHFASDHGVAKQFSSGDHTHSDDLPEDYEGPMGHVVHVKLHLKNPKVYASEHDMDQEVYEHEWEAGNHHDKHIDPPPEDEDEYEEWAEEWGHRHHYAGDSQHKYSKNEPDPNYAYGFHPKATGWLNTHPDKVGIVQRYKDRMKRAGYDGVVYGNEYEGGGKSAIAFEPHQIEITQHHYGHHGCLTPEQAKRTLVHPGQQMLPGTEDLVRRPPKEPKRPDLSKHWPTTFTPSFTDNIPRYAARGAQRYDTGRLWAPLPQECWDRYYGRHTGAQSRTAAMGDPTDWDAHYDPGMQVHRGMVVKVPYGLYDKLHDPDSTAEAAQELADRTSKRASTGMHWSADLEQARDFPTRNVAQGSTVPVILHAQVPAREGIETRPSMLRRNQVFPHDHWEREVPLRKGTGVDVFGVSWKPDGAHPHADEHGWVRHDFTAPVRHTATRPIDYSDFTEGQRTVFDAHHQGRNVGYVTTDDRGDHVWLDEVYVHPDYRGSGIARGLMDRALRHHDGREVRLKPEPYSVKGEASGASTDVLRRWYGGYGFEPDGEHMVRKTAASESDEERRARIMRIREERKRRRNTTPMHKEVDENGVVHYRTKQPDLSAFFTPIPEEELKAQRERAKPKPEPIDDRTYSLDDVSRRYGWEGFDGYEISHLVHQPAKATFSHEDVPVHSLRLMGEDGRLKPPVTHQEIADQGEDEQERLEGLRRGYEQGDAIPPIVVVRHGEHHIIADGSHRAAIAAERGDTHIPAFVTERTKFGKTSALGEESARQHAGQQDVYAVRSGNSMVTLCRHHADAHVGNSGFADDLADRAGIGQRERSAEILGEPRKGSCAACNRDTGYQLKLLTPRWMQNAQDSRARRRPDKPLKTRPLPTLKQSENSMAGKLYHISPKEHRKNIQQQGLTRAISRGGKYYLASDPDEMIADLNLGTASDFSNHDVWEVDAQGLKLHDDPESPGSWGAVYTRQKIGPERLRLRKSESIRAARGDVFYADTGYGSGVRFHPDGTPQNLGDHTVPAGAEVHHDANEAWNKAIEHWNAGRSDFPRVYVVHQPKVEGGKLTHEADASELDYDHEKHPVLRSVNEEPHEPIMYHGTTRHEDDDLPEEITPSGGSQSFGPGVADPDYAYATPSLHDAWTYAEKRSENGLGGRPTVYRVTPHKPEDVEKDPTWAGEYSRGNNEHDKRSKSGFEVLDEVPMSQRQEHEWSQSPFNDEAENEDYGDEDDHHYASLMTLAEWDDEDDKPEWCEECGEEHTPDEGHRECAACGERHEDYEDKDRHESTMTDWDDVYPRLNSHVHRVLPHMTLPDHVHEVVHDESRPMAERGRALLDHVAKEHGRWGLGMHWSDVFGEGRGHGADKFAGVGGGDERDTQVVLHARKPDRDDIETDPDTLDEHQVYGYDVHDENEVPIQQRVPVHITGVSWRPGGYHQEWRHHDLKQPIEMTAALRTLADWDDDEDDDSPEECEHCGEDTRDPEAHGEAHEDWLRDQNWHTDWDADREVGAHNNGEIQRGMAISLPKDVHRIVHDEDRPLAERGRALAEHVIKSANDQGHIGRFWTDEDEVARRYATDSRIRIGGKDDNGTPATPVTLHVRFPGYHHIETDPDELEHHNVYSYHLEDNREVPLQHGTPLEAVGVSWAHHKYGDDGTRHWDRDNADWKRHTFKEPIKAMSSKKPLPTLRMLAHDATENQAIRHCPFCGGGKIIGRADGSVECEFCHNFFTVQVQPQYPNFPQTINGMPQQIPGMPGQVETPQMDGGGLPPGQEGDDTGDAPPWAQDGAQSFPDDAAEEKEAGDGEDEEEPPPFAKQSSLPVFRTHAGALLGEDDYVRHLAIRHARDRDAMIARIREECGAE